MALIHNLGFPRVGKHRELKFALEKYWRSEIDETELQGTAKALRKENWQYQADFDYLPVGDFSLYDQVLDMSFTLGNVPERISSSKGHEIDKYFRLARGRSANDNDCQCLRAGEMTKWFDSNYHYIVPELSAKTTFNLHAENLLQQIDEAKSLGYQVKPVIIGPLSYLWLAKSKDDSDKLNFLDSLLQVYGELLQRLADINIEWVQVDEPILVTELDESWKIAFERSYQTLKSFSTKLLLTTYFGQLKENLSLACHLPVEGLHIDAIQNQQVNNEATNQAIEAVEILSKNQDNKKILSLGVINGRNIWKTDLNKTLKWLHPIAEKLKDRLWLAPSCSLLHVPVDLKLEANLDEEIKDWMAFAVQKLDELKVLQLALNKGEEAVNGELEDNKKSINARLNSSRIHSLEIKEAVKNIDASFGQRKSSYEIRAVEQHQRLNLPNYPTTTIGSFPQTKEIRQNRLQYKKGMLNQQEYVDLMQAEIARSVAAQESIGLDVLVHGEAERNDMVEYFGEQLNGYAFTEFGWVQSYGSRCVKPPVLFGDISRPKAMTVEWIKYAKSLTAKPMKGMLTGPVTILNWSFVRDDQPRSETCFQLALAIREEVLDLEKAGINIIQIDEAALREGLPLRKSEWVGYLDWAIEAFKISANGVSDATQIHTHMCYSEFNDIIEAISKMDADVITIENARSDRELLDVFAEYSYPNAIGPGVYDIHSPNTPSVEQIVDIMNTAAQRVPAKRLWINPDCGLKTRQWQEVIPALDNMIKAAHQLRQQI